MTRRRLATVLLAAAAVWFGVRFGAGLFAGARYSEGRRLARQGSYELALPLLDRSAVGELRSPARWLASQVRLGLWQDRIAAGADPADEQALLDGALVDASAALAASPASGWYWMALGNLYHQRERLDAYRQGVPLELVGTAGWGLVGRPGRIAVGFLRIGLEREPNWYEFHDQLAYVYYDYRLRDEMLDAVYRSALALPVYELHPYRTLRPRDREVEDAFARGARDALGEAPWIREVLHRIALGRLEVRRERWAEAEADLRAALAGPTERINVAEANYYLALSLAAQGRRDEARAAIEIAATHPAIEPMAVVATAGWAEEEEAPVEEVTRLWMRARRLAPERLDISLRLARYARGHDEVELAAHVLREAVRTHPDEVVPWLELARVQRLQGKTEDAEESLETARRKAPGHPGIAELERVLRGPAKP